MRIVAISGSLRKDSFNTKLLENMQKLAPEGMDITIADLGGIPIYDQDAEASFPKEAQSLKDAIEGADGIIIATPEYNRSVPGMLKNAIDWASRPYGKNSFTGKPVLVAGVSGGSLGTLAAQMHLKQILVHLNTRVIGQPELYIGNGGSLFDEQGAIVEDSTKELLTSALATLAEEISR